MVAPATAAAAFRTPTFAAFCSLSREKERGVSRDGLRRDKEGLLGWRLRAVSLSLLPDRNRISKALEDLMWLRFLEDRRTINTPRTSSSWPKISYHGLSGLDLLMADLGALKVYGNYVKSTLSIWSTPMPEAYDPDTVAEYFRFRPHILVVRIIEVFLAFLMAAMKLQLSTTFGFRMNDTIEHDNLDSSQFYIGQLLKETMINLGPTFIKVGQTLSTRPDIIGSEISKALSELHDNVPPFSHAMAMKIIEEELGSPVDKIFRKFSKEPVAAASFGQVYRGCTVDGYDVAVKVQRPNMLHVVVRDIFILRLGLSLLRKIGKRRSDFGLYADELGKGFVGELDYTLEAANASEFLETHSQYSFIKVPKVFRHLTRKKVLTMEWVVGESPNELIISCKCTGQENIGDLTKQLVARARLLDLVNKGVEASLVQLLETGLLHADPHSGNLRYTPEGKLGFLDFGLLCRMEKKHQLGMLSAIVHIVNGDWAALIYDLRDMDIIRPGTNLRLITMDLEDALGVVVLDNNIPDIKFSNILGKIWSVAVKYHLRMPPYYTLLLRSLASLEGLAVAGDQEFRTFQAAYPYVVQKILYENSLDTRRILHSVVFNKKREFQWQKILLFLRTASKRANDVNDKIQKPGTLVNAEMHLTEAVDLILKLLSSRDGVVVRRLLMTADSTSLARAAISEEAIFIRKYTSRALSDLIYSKMISAVRSTGLPEHGERVAGAASGSALFFASRDRRLKVIQLKVLGDIRRNPLLTIRLCWCAFKIFAAASASALRRFVLHLAVRYLSMVPHVPRVFATVGV